MALDTPPLNSGTLSLRYYTDEEKQQIDLQLIGVDDEGDHVRDEMGPDGSGSTRRYECNWEERYAAAIMLVGACKSYTDTSGKKRISRLLPDSHGGRLENNWVCTKVAIDPFRYLGTISDADFGQDFPDFEKAKLTATYELVPYDLFDDDELEAGTEFDRYVTTPGHPGADVTSQTNVITMAGGTMSFTTESGSGVPAGIPIPYGIGRPETVTTNRWIWDRVPKDLWAPDSPLWLRIKGNGTNANRGYIGSMNLTTFYGRGPLTLKLEAVEEKLLPDASGIGYSWRLVFVIAEKNVPYGHIGFWFANSDGNFNGYFQAQKSGSTLTLSPATLVTAGDYQTLFHIREFADLFRVDTLP